MGRPSMRTPPFEAGARPAIAFNTVDLPEPDSPTIPKVSPRATSKETSCTASTRLSPLLKVTLKFSTAMAGAAVMPSTPNRARRR